MRAVEFCLVLQSALNGDCLGARAFNLRAHKIECIGERDDFGFTRGVFETCLSLSEACGHEHHVSCADRREGQAEAIAFECERVGRLDMDAIMVELHLSAERAQSFEVDFDGTRADGIAAWERHDGLTGARDEGPDDPKGSAHLCDEVLRCAGCGNFFSGEFDLFFLGVVAALSAESFEQFGEDGGIGEVGDVIEGEGLVGEEARDHHREDGVFGAADGDGSIEGISAGNLDALCFGGDVGAEVLRFAAPEVIAQGVFARLQGGVLQRCIFHGLWLPF